MIVVSEAVVAEKAEKKVTQENTNNVSVPNVPFISSQAKTPSESESLQISLQTSAESQVRSQSETSQKSSLAEMAQEVIKRKHEETVKNGGVAPSDSEMRRICENVLDDYRRCKLNGCDNVETSDDNHPIPSDDMENSSLYDSAYAPAEY
jgi:hypothetical protein